MITNGVIEINGDRISYVGPVSGYDMPAEARVINAAGGTVMPGVVNSSVRDTHSNSETDFAGQAIRRSFLIDGVTTTCNTGHPLAGMASFNVTATSGGEPAGRAFNSGPTIAAPNGYPAADFGDDYIYAVSGVEQARAAVADLVGQGADYIKVSIETGFFPNTPGPLNLLTPEELAAIVDEAHMLGVQVRAHVSDSDLLHMALDAGVDVIEHVPAFRHVPVEQATNLQRIFDLDVQEVRDMRAMLDRMVAQGVVLVPTLMVMNVEKPWVRTFNGQTISVYEEVVRYYHNIGGTVALGNDYPLDRQTGMPLQEMNALQRAGLSNAAIITAATYNAALACGQPGEVGSLDVGKLADVILVGGNPQTNFSNLSNVNVVILGGEVIVGEEFVTAPQP